MNADFPDFFSLFFNPRLSAKICVPFFASTVQNLLDHDIFPVYSKLFAPICIEFVANSRALSQKTRFLFGSNF